jgi:hypothetical protein
MNRTTGIKLGRGAVAVGLALLAITWSGCEARPPTGKVSGKVSLQGQPVTGGSVTFVPIAQGGTTAGRPAIGPIQPDGTFTLSTYAQGDGAIIGRHRVMFSAPTGKHEEAGKHDEGQASAPADPFAGVTPKEAQVEVKSGENTIDIELVSPGGASAQPAAPSS